MKYKLTRCVWEITLACPFSCRYCGSGGGRARENELSTQECLDTADALAELGCERVSLIGGEVFARLDWQRIAKRLSGHGIAVNLITNGWMFNDVMLEELQACRLESVSVSLDGPREIHDRYRHPGSFDRAVQTVKKLAEGGIPVSLITTLHAENAGALEEMLDVVRGLPVFAWQLQACSPMGNARENALDHRFDFRGVIAFVEKHAGEDPFFLGIADNIGYFTPSEGRLRGNLSGKAYFKGCRAGISAVGIDSIGNVRGCESMYDDFFSEGNLRERSLKEIWEDPDAFAYNRKFTPAVLEGKCADCRMGPFCGAGCRSYNYFVHGKLFESPYCARECP